MEEINTYLEQGKGVIFYDEYCNLCLFWVNQVCKKFDKKGQFKYISINKSVTVKILFVNS